MIAERILTNKMGTKKKDFDKRKTTVGVSLSNEMLKFLDEFCSNYNYSRSAILEGLLRYCANNHDEFYTIIDEWGINNYERN